MGSQTYNQLVQQIILATDAGTLEWKFSHANAGYTAQVGGTGPARWLSLVVSLRQLPTLKFLRGPDNDAESGMVLSPRLLDAILHQVGDAPLQVACLRQLHTELAKRIPPSI